MQGRGGAATAQAGGDVGEAGGRACAWPMQGRRRRRSSGSRGGAIAGGAAAGRREEPQAVMEQVAGICAEGESERGSSCLNLGVPTP